MTKKENTNLVTVNESQQTGKKYEELTFSDQFMFGKVMLDSERCRKVLERLLQRPIGELHDVINEKHMKETADGKAIRLDIFTRETDSGTLFDAEMQNQNHQSLEDMNLPKRSRFYQSEIDVSFLAEKASFRDLAENNIIFICTFDPCKRGQAFYHYENKSDENPPLPLNDGTHKYFFNCTYEGTDIPEELQIFYRYVMSGIAEDALTEDISQAVEIARRNGEWRNEYMREGLYLDDAYHEGKAAGRKEGIQTGTEQALIQLSKKGLLSIEDAAKELNITPEEFKKKRDS